MEKTNGVDLHTHTRASDGELSPSALVEEAHRVGLKAVAVTDHDTVEGVVEAVRHADGLNLEVIPGIEISVAVGDGRTFHLLGYDLDVDNPDLRHALERLQMARWERNARIVQRLAELGLPMENELRELIAEGGQVGRPHLARTMVQLGYAASIEEAFRLYLSKGASAYVDKSRLNPKEAISLVRRAGGVPVMAHPFSSGFSTSMELESLVAHLVGKTGLMGIEVLYPEHDSSQTALFCYLSDKYGLLKTGGTDFHGKNRKGVMLGWGYGGLRVPWEWAADLRREARNIKGFTP